MQKLNIEDLKQISAGVAELPTSLTGALIKAKFMRNHGDDNHVCDEDCPQFLASNDDDDVIPGI